MTKIKLIDGTVIDSISVEVTKGILKITTNDFTPEQLAAFFGNSENTSIIKIMTESEIESGAIAGFTSFVGVIYNEDKTKTVGLVQPVNSTESMISDALFKANSANTKTEELEAVVNAIIGVSGGDDNG